VTSQALAYILLNAIAEEQEALGETAWQSGDTDAARRHFVAMDRASRTIGALQDIENAEQQRAALEAAE